VNQEEHDKSLVDVEGQTPGKVPRNLFKVYQRVDIKEHSEEELVNKYTPMVLKLVHRIAPMTRSVVDIEDLKNVAFFALVQSARTFDPEFGVAFEVYCRPRLRGAILDEIRKNSSFTRSAYAKWKKLERAIQDQEEKLGRPPTEVDMAAALGISVYEYRDLLDDLRLVAYVSLDELMDRETESGDFTPYQLEDLHQTDPAHQSSVRDLQQIVRERILQMTPKQKKVLTLYYYEGLRFKDIAILLKVSESRICQIHTEAILSLRAFLDREESLVNKN
jgi:RNA polymerase sigma factor FliA